MSTTEATEHEPIATSTFEDELDEVSQVIETTTPVLLVSSTEPLEEVSQPAGPRVKSNILANNGNRQQNKFGKSTRPPFGPTPRSKSPATSTTTTTTAFEEPTSTTSAPFSEFDNEVPELAEADNAAADAKGPAVAQLKPDGRSPRVKSNIKALLSFRGRNPSTKSKVPILREQSEQEQEIPETTREGRTRAGSGRAINLDLVNLIN